MIDVHEIASNDVDFLGSLESLLDNNLLLNAQKWVHCFLNLTKKLTPEGWDLGNCVNGSVSIDDLGKRVSSCWESWIVHQNVVSTVSVSQNPMSSVVHVQDNDVSAVKVFLDFSVWDFSFVGKAELVNGSPDEEVTTGISSVFFEPSVKSSRVVAVSSSREGHWGGAHQATSLTNGVGWGSKVFITPAGVTLLVQRIGSGETDGYQQDEDEEFHVFV